ncbi:hypothetical protein JXQ70_10425 [bacterium]|nr:hypothetical protein [bacterium]
MKTQNDQLEVALQYPGFRGRYDHSIDDRGRLVLPVLYRRVFELHYQSLRIYLTRDSERYLIVYPLSVWAEHEQEMIEHVRYSKTIKEQLFLSSYYGLETALDSAGRLLVPRSFREETGLASEIVIIGKINHFEIWDRKQAEDYAKSLASFDAEVRLAEIGEQVRLSRDKHDESGK